MRQPEVGDKHILFVYEYSEKNSTLETKLGFKVYKLRDLCPKNKKMRHKRRMGSKGSNRLLTKTASSLNANLYPQTKDEHFCRRRVKRKRPPADFDIATASEHNATDAKQAWFEEESFARIHGSKLHCRSSFSCRLIR